jgi:putative ABC transport system substrate-binding protein
MNARASSSIGANPRVSRRRLIGWSAAVTALASGFGSADLGSWTSAAEAAGLDQAAPPPAPIPFVSPSLESLGKWDVTQDTPDKSRYTLRRKGVSEPGAASKRVLVPFAKPSQPFDGVLTKLLDVLDERQQPVTLVLWNYNQKLDVLPSIIAYGESEKFDLLAPMGSEATQNIRDVYLNGALPTLSLYTKDPVLQGWAKDYAQGSGTNFAYCSVAVPMDVQMAYLRQLNPQGVKNIGLIYSSASQSTVDAQVTPLKAIAVPQGINVVDAIVNDEKRPEPEVMAAIPKAIEQIRGNDPDLKQSVFWATGTTSVINSVELISKLAGNVQVVASLPDMVKEGSGSAMMSVGIEYENVGYLAAASMLDILYKGAKPADMPIGVITPPDLAISFLKARQVGLKVPFSFFENASFVYDDNGKLVRQRGQAVR